MLGYFERLVDPYPEGEPLPPPQGVFPFIWSASAGVRRFVLAMTLLTATIGAFEALLFAVMGHMVDWLSQVKPAQLWTQEHAKLILLGVILTLSPLLVSVQAALKYQTLFGNFPMRLRWNFHRMMLAQSMSFYQDEFAGRVAAKVMQTALGVRDVITTCTDILVFVIIYFVTMIAVVGGFDLWLLGPFLGWLALYACALRFFVPRLGKVGALQADARSLMTGRITDAYTNISTVKLFSHARREASYAKQAMQEFHRHRVPAGPLHHRHRGRQPCAEHGADHEHGRCHAVAVDAGPGRRRRGRGIDGAGAAPERHLALDHVGAGLAVREHRHGHRWHEHAVPAARDRRRTRGAGASRCRAARSRSRTSASRTAASAR